MWFKFFVYTLFWLNPSDYFLSHDCFYIVSIKASVIFPTPASTVTPDEGPYSSGNL
jgi:hypothetical protein